MAIQIGDVVGDYKVTGVLGRGGMGKVFRVRSLLTDREEAMKVVLADLDENPDFVERFLREIKVHASLQHPNIAALYSAQRIHDRLVMILELVEGVSLEDLLRPQGIEVSEALHYVTQVLAALAFAHQRGVTHRDIKPANILIGKDGVVKLTDFGIARSASAAQLTGSGLAVGTLAYMSPEQIMAGQVDARSDIYSLGLTFYEMVVGRRPIQGQTDHALMNAHLNLIPPEPNALNPRIPGSISAAIMRALAKDPTERFQTADEFRTALLASGQRPEESRAPSRSFDTSVNNPELADLESRLSRAVGPIAHRLVLDAARQYATISEIRQALALQIDDPQARKSFLSSSPAVTVTLPPRTPATVGFDPAVLERLSQTLALYIGPIAKVVVTRASRSARSLEELQSTVAAEIDSDTDRRRFLAAARAT